MFAVQKTSACVASLSQQRGDGGFPPFFAMFHWLTIRRAEVPHAPEGIMRFADSRGPSSDCQTLPTVRSLMRGWISFCDMTNVCGRNLSTMERT